MAETLIPSHQGVHDSATGRQGDRHDRPQQALRPLEETASCAE
jgi:hypothetical protein